MIFKHLLSSIFIIILSISNAKAEPPISFDLSDEQQLTIFGIVCILVIVGLILEHTSWGEKYFGLYYVILFGTPTTALLIWLAIEDKSPLFAISAIIVAFGCIVYIKNKPDSENK